MKRNLTWLISVAGGNSMMIKRFFLTVQSNLFRNSQWFQDASGQKTFALFVLYLFNFFEGYMYLLLQEQYLDKLLA